MKTFEWFFKSDYAEYREVLSKRKKDGWYVIYSNLEFIDLGNGIRYAYGVITFEKS